ncbi:hypothetical protein [Antarctobacter jejuensis]|uniref:hypothetical protein n=1 Tax=Antarctobacter jejuensis TaxID=1439938 RepID=UPI003FD079EC
MKKLGIFVEGQTEAIFSEFLVMHLADGICADIDVRRFFGGRRFNRMELSAHIIRCGGGGEPTHYILIRNCGTDGRVVSDINEQCGGLKDGGFQKIIGLRDVRPINRDKISRLRSGIHGSLHSLEGFHISVHLAVMEIEAWMMAENTHFQRLNEGLTEQRIEDEVGFFPQPNNVSERDDASGDLRSIYSIVDEVYDKTEPSVRRTHGLLSFERICQEVSDDIDDLKDFIDQIRSFFE